MSGIGFDKMKAREPASQKQLFMIRKLLDAQQMSITQQFFWILNQTDREIDSPKELTKREASKLIQQLIDEKERA